MVSLPCSQKRFHQMHTWIPAAFRRQSEHPKGMVPLYFCQPSCHFVALLSTHACAYSFLLVPAQGLLHICSTSSPFKLRDSDLINSFQSFFLGHSQTFLSYIPLSYSHTLHHMRASITLCYNCLFITLTAHILCKLHGSKAPVTPLDHCLAGNYVPSPVHSKCWIYLCDFLLSLFIMLFS